MHFSLPCLFLCCLPLSLHHLISYSLTPFISVSQCSCSFFFFFLLCLLTDHCDCLTLPWTKWGIERDLKHERSRAKDIASGDNIFTGFPVSFNPVLYKRFASGHFPFMFCNICCQLCPLFSCHLSLLSNHFHFL